MPELTIFQKILIFALVASWIIAAFCAARMARNFNRSPLIWFCITIFLSAIPATIVFWTEQRKRIIAQKSQQPEQSSETLTRCPHCGEVITGPDETTGQDECPNCKLAIDERHLA